VWALEQAETAAEVLGTYRAQVADARNTVPAVSGFSLRFPWSAVDEPRTLGSLLSAGKRVADENGLKFSVRFMAGRSTPSRLLAQMGPAYTASSAAGEVFPMPFRSDGTAGNPYFADAYEALLRRLATWYDANGCTLLHAAWYGMEWAELNHGMEIRGAPGYSEPAWLSAHQWLVNRAAAVQADHPDVVFEWPLSGYGPLATMSPALADHIVRMFGAHSNKAVIQANGWSHEGQWGARIPAVDAAMDACFRRPVARGVQAIRGWGESTLHPQYSRAQIARALNRARACSAGYVELYLPTLLSANGGAAWQAPLSDWVAHG
jgi:hypothetical protein